MKYPWIEEYLMEKPGVTKDLQKDWNWIRFQLAGKMFAAICLDDNDKPYYITLKLEPMEGEFWRGQYEDIIPGYYMNKVHWNSVKADGEVPDDILMDLLDHAYQIVLGDLSKKKQKEILGDSRGYKEKENVFSKVEFLTIEEGLCVQCMHIGSYDIRHPIKQKDTSNF